VRRPGGDEEADPESAQAPGFSPQEQPWVVRAKRRVVRLLERHAVDRVEVAAPGREPAEQRRVPEADVEGAEATRAREHRAGGGERRDHRPECTSGIVNGKLFGLSYFAATR
jgi:hypothetical protein